MKLKRKLITLILVFALVYTALALINLFLLGVATEEVSYVLIGVAIFSSGLGVVLFDETEKDSPQRLLVKQVSYVLSLLLLVAIISYLFNWNQTWYALGLNFLTIILLFISIKAIVYHKDQQEANSINDYLSRRQQKNKHN